MKKIKCLLLAIVLMYVLTGCVRFNYDLNIKGNGKCDATIVYAVMEEYSDEELLADEELSQMEDEGWEWENYSEDGYIGYTFSQKNKPLKSGGLEFLGDDGVEVEKKGGKYILKSHFYAEDDWDEIFSYKSAIERSGGYMRFVVHLPKKSITNNATSVSEDGKTLTWNLLAMNYEEAYAEFKLPFPIWGIVAFIIAWIFAGLIVVSVHDKNKNKNIAVFNTGITPNRNTADEPFYCPYCGTRNGADAIFCERCGAKMKE